MKWARILLFLLTFIHFVSSQIADAEQSSCGKIIMMCYISGILMTMSMLKQASSKSWLISKLWLLDLEIVVVKKGCEKFSTRLSDKNVDSLFFLRKNLLWLLQIDIKSWNKRVALWIVLSLTSLSYIANIVCICI